VSLARGQIGRYVELTLLGQGGMGAVYRGRDPELDRAVAVKVMREASPDFVARFRREAQSIARLAHANIVQVYDFGVDEEGNPYFVMELIDGTPLDAIMRARGRLAPVEAIRLVRQAAEGLAAAHRAGIVHRDVKPSNLIVDGGGHVKLVDFGIARVAQGGAQLTGAAALMGTPGYMAPEQAAGRTVDERADIYALGLTLFELVAGAPPYQAGDPITLVVRAMNEPLPDLRQRDLGLPEELVALIEQMGAKDPAERLQSCEAVIAALDGILAHIQAGPDTGAIPTNRIPVVEADAHAVVAALGALAALALLAGGVLLARAPQPPPQTQTKTNTTETKTETITKTDTPPKPATLPTATGPLRVAVLKFKNISNDPELQSMELGIGESVLSSLAGARGVQLIERADLESDIGEIDRAKDEHFDKASVARLGQLKGIELAVQGGFQRAGKSLRVTARFVRVENGEIVDTLNVTRPARDLFGAQDEVAAGLQKKLIALAAQEKPKP
jgi:serine/threonine-protein kinase